jgi:FlaA1/EpsC-like NDP-sugar epimerase
MTRKHLRLQWLPRALVILHDLAMVSLSWLGLYWLANQAGAPDPSHLYQTLSLALLVQGLVFWRIGLYRGVWRFASVPDLVNLASAALVGQVLIIAVLLVSGWLPEVPRRVLVPYAALLILMLSLPRLLYRMWKDFSMAQARRDGAATRVLVLGAGRAGELLLRELRAQDRYQVVGLLDDIQGLKGAKIQGIEVLSNLDKVAVVARETAADMLVIAMPSASLAQMRRVVQLCESTGLPFRKISRLAQQLEPKASAFSLEEVAIQDLLGRDPVQFDWRSVSEAVGGKSVAITGAGGSIGAELSRQCARAGVGRLILIERSELPLLDIHKDLLRHFPQLDVVAMLADCGDAMSYRAMLENVDFVFHAAACKQVPMLEGQVRAALRNNVQATCILARACRAAKVPNFVLISTDKAIEPASVLGASKRLAELACQALFAGAMTRLSIVRFGNVIDSAGSVVPLFRQQIAAGGPVTVTDPEVTRYFMTIPEACQLILQASRSSFEPVSVLTLDMGASVSIRELAEQMIRLSGHAPGHDIAIIYTGLRPGEKLHEIVSHPDESCRRTSNSRVLRADPRPVDAPFVLRVLERLEGLLQASCDERQFKQFLHETISDYRPIEARVVPLAQARAQAKR